MMGKNPASLQDWNYFLRGLAARTALIECPLGSFEVRVERCAGQGECAAVCMVNVFKTNERGECTVVNEALCFGCMACVAQCSEKGVSVVPTGRTEELMQILV